MTDIEWCDVTWNCVVGCSRVSAGCVNCFAERFVHRGLAPQHRGLTVMRGGRPGWTGEVRLVPERLAEPLSWKKPRRVFVNSLSDLFHEALAFEDIAAIFGVMAVSPQHTFQVLTKRPERARAFFEWAKASAHECSPSDVCLYAARMAIPEGPADPWEPRIVSLGLDRRDEEVDWPLPNVWIGASVEDQATADERIPHLLACPAAVRFVSYEPALGPVDLRRFMWPVHARWTGPHPSAEAARAAGETVTMHRQALVLADCVFLDWVIAGGESGPGARPFDLAWARSVVTQCREAGVACFVKQLGASPVDGTRSAIHDAHGLAAPSLDHDEAMRLVAGYRGGHVVRPAPVRLRDRKGGDMSEWPEDLRVREMPEVRP